MKQITRWVFVLALVTCSSMFAVVRSQTADQRSESLTLVIQGGTLIDGTGAPARNNGTILVRGSKILSVFRDAHRPVPEGARVVNAQGKYVLPGLIDGHTHYFGHAAPMYMHYGITSVVSTGGSTWEFAQKWAIEKGLVPGPKIYAAGGSISSPLLGPVQRVGSTGLVETVDEARAAVRRRVAGGADGIKVHKAIRPDLARAVIDEAHLHGIPVTGHITFSARDAVMMGIDSLEHASGIQIATTTDRDKLKETEEKRFTDPGYMFEHATMSESFAYMKPELYGDLIKLLVEKGTSVTPTLVCYWSGVHPHSDRYEKEDRALLADPAYAFVPALDRRHIFLAYDYFRRIKAEPKYQQGYRNLQAFLKQFAQAGGKIVAGADAVYYELHGISTHRELELLVDAGLTPMQALMGATKYAAEKYWKGHEVGTVEAGKYADFLIVDANPLDDIRNTQKIHLVIQNGQVVDTRLDGAFTEQIPQPPRSQEAIAETEKLLFGVGR